MLSFLVQLIVSFRAVWFQKNLMVAAAVAILRLWTMYNRSRLILSVLIALFSMEILVNVLGAAIYSDPRNESGM